MVSGPPPSFPWANVHVRVFSCVVAFSILATCSVVLAPMGFRFRYRKVWGFKSLLVHSLAPWASGLRLAVQAEVRALGAPPVGEPAEIVRFFAALKVRERGRGPSLRTLGKVPQRCFDACADQELDVEAHA